MHNLRRMLTCPIKRKQLNELNCLTVSLTRRVRELFENNEDDLYLLLSSSKLDDQVRGEIVLNGIQMTWCSYEFKEPDHLCISHHILVSTKAEDDEFGVIETELQMLLNYEELAYE